MFDYFTIITIIDDIIYLFNYLFIYLFTYVLAQCSLY